MNNNLESGSERVRQLPVKRLKKRSGTDSDF